MDKYDYFLGKVITGFCSNHVFMNTLKDRLIVLHSEQEKETPTNEELAAYVVTIASTYAKKCVVYSDQNHNTKEQN